MALLTLVAAGLGVPGGVHERADFTRAASMESGPADPSQTPGSATRAQADAVGETTAQADAGADPEPASDSDSADQSGSEDNNKEPTMRTGVPEGFEAYMEPQKTLVEVYFGGRPVATVMAEFTPETIELLEPDKVIESLNGVKVTDRLREHFRGPMPTHGNRVCVGPGDQDCGSLEPEVIGVIFNERRFRADLFVNPEFLVDTTPEQQTYLAAPDQAGPGLVQNLSVNHAGNSQGQDRFSLFGRTRVGQGTSHLFSNWASTDEQDLTVDELGFRHDFRDHQFTAGLYEPRSQLLTALRRDPLAGVGIERTFNRRRDLDTAFATDVEIVLNSRARVELIRDGRLHDVRFYDAGRHRIDTARLPSGAYNLEIRITESGGATRTLERFFVKSQRLAPGGEPLWFAHLGRAYRRDPDSEFPEDTGTMLARSGLQYRHREQLGLGVAGAAVEDSALGELSANWLTPALQTHGSVFASTEGGTGWLVRGRAARGNWRLIADSERIQAKEPDVDADYVLLPDRLERERVEVRTAAAGGHYFASWQRLQRNDDPAQRTATLGYTHTFRLGGHQSLNLNTSVSRSNGDHEALLSLDWRFTTSRWQHQARLAHRESERAGDADGVNARASTTWQDGDTLVDDLQLSAGVEADENARRASLDGQYNWQYGRGRAGVSSTRHEERTDRHLSSAAYDTNLVATPGSAAVGGPELNEAGVIVDLRGAEGALFDILVDGKKRFVARGGRRAAFTLAPYDEYEVAIQDRGTDFVHYDNTSRRVTLYPGNVENLVWELQKVTIILGILQRPDGTPLGGAVIEGTRGVTASDPDGYFQGEILGRDAELTARVHGERCRLDTGPIRVENGVARLGRVACHPVANSQGKGRDPDGTEEASSAIRQ